MKYIFIALGFPLFFIGTIIGSLFWMIGAGFMFAGDLIDDIIGKYFKG